MMDRSDSLRKIAAASFAAAGVVALATLMGFAANGYDFALLQLAGSFGILLGAPLGLLAVRARHSRLRGVAVAVGAWALYAVVGVSDALVGYLPGWLSPFFHAIFHANAGAAGALGFGAVLGISVAPIVAFQWTFARRENTR